MDDNIRTLSPSLNPQRIPKTQLSKQKASDERVFPFSLSCVFPKISEIVFLSLISVSQISVFTVFVETSGVAESGERLYGWHYSTEKMTFPTSGRSCFDRFTSPRYANDVKRIEGWDIDLYILVYIVEETHVSVRSVTDVRNSKVHRLALFGSQVGKALFDSDLLAENLGHCHSALSWYVQYSEERALSLELLIHWRLFIRHSVHPRCPPPSIVLLDVMVDLKWSSTGEPYIDLIKGYTYTPMRETDVDDYVGSYWA